MRGKVRHYVDVQPVQGITPAYAGKSAKRLAEITRTKDHPRLCGEKFLNQSQGFATARITPAYAGKRIIIFVDTGYQRDHPRLCGEKERASEYIDMVTGSPPPMRGKGDLMPAEVIANGITPDYAGKSKCC